MIIVTGAAGFIGSHIVETLNQRGIDDILIVDDLTDGHKFSNLAHLRFTDYLDKDEFRSRIAKNTIVHGVRAVIHQGACSDTMEWDGRYMMDNNYQFSKELCEWAILQETPFIYASSAAVYGHGSGFTEMPANEHPLNVYGYSKLLFDNYVRRRLPEVTSPIVGLRYFNVYGSREFHKGRMASVISQWWRRVQRGEALRLFEGSDGFGPGEQRRDFIYVGDVAALNCWFLENPDVSGIFNCGTGRSASFNDVAKAIIELQGQGQIKYSPFPDELRGAYQSFTEADLNALKTVHPTLAFTPLPVALQQAYAHSRG